MRFYVGQVVSLARLPEDPERAASVEPFLGRKVEVTEIEGQLYKVRLGSNLKLYASDDMLDPLPPPKRIDEEGGVHF